MQNGLCVCVYIDILIFTVGICKCLGSLSSSTPPTHNGWSLLQVKGAEALTRSSLNDSSSTMVIVLTSIFIMTALIVFTLRSRNFLRHSMSLGSIAQTLRF